MAEPTTGVNCVHCQAGTPHRITDLGYEVHTAMPCQGCGAPSRYGKDGKWWCLACWLVSAH